MTVGVLSFNGDQSIYLCLGVGLNAGHRESKLLTKSSIVRHHIRRIVREGDAAVIIAAIKQKTALIHREKRGSLLVTRDTIQVDNKAQRRFLAAIGATERLGTIHVVNISDLLKRYRGDLYDRRTDTIIRITGKGQRHSGGSSGKAGKCQC